jgi:hypothetical protein
VGTCIKAGPEDFDIVIIVHSSTGRTQVGSEGTGVRTGGIVCYERADMAVQGAVGAAEAEFSKSEGELGMTFRQR